MTWLVQARLVNGPFLDPGLFVDFRFGRRALLFDLGDLAPLSSRELLRVSHAFVSHMHMDHFSGFDQLLRLCLHRSAALHLVGPEGLVDAVDAKLRAYTWNLLDEESADFAIGAADYAGAGMARAAVFRAREAFRPRPVEPPALPAGVLLDEEAFRIETAVLDHGTPCLAFALQEKLRVNVWRAGLDAAGLPVGPWLEAAKRAVRAGEPDAALVTVAPGVTVPLGFLKERALKVAPGQRLVYVVDAAYHARNIERIVALARGADRLFIEAAFLDEDAALARGKRHLTARQAGEIAGLAGVGHVTPLHVSPRYLDREAAARGEVEAAFAAARREEAGEDGGEAAG